MNFISKFIKKIKSIFIIDFPEPLLTQNDIIDVSSSLTIPIKDWKAKARELGVSWANMTFYLFKSKTATRSMPNKFDGKKEDIFLYYKKIIEDLNADINEFADVMYLAAEDRWFELIATENYKKTSNNKLQIN
jgi:hypothetical protein